MPPGSIIPLFVGYACSRGVRCCCGRAGCSPPLAPHSAAVDLCHPGLCCSPSFLTQHSARSALLVAGLECHRSWAGAHFSPSPPVPTAGLAYCRHLSTVRTHLSALVNHTIVPPDKPSSAAGGLTKEVWSKYQKDKKVRNRMLLSSLLQLPYTAVLSVGPLGMDPRKHWRYLLGFAGSLLFPGRVSQLLQSLLSFASLMMAKIAINIRAADLMLTPIH